MAGTAWASSTKMQVGLRRRGRPRHSRISCIAGVEPDEPEETSDFERLMNPVTPARSAKVGRNEPCPCSSGKKYKRCCADKEEAAQTDVFPAGRFRYEPMSLKDAGYVRMADFRRAVDQDADSSAR